MAERPRSPTIDGTTAGMRHLSVRAYVGIVVAYLFILLVATVFTLDRTLDSPGLTETGEVARQLVIRMTIPLVFVYAIVAALRWQRPVLEDRRPVQRWVWIVPGSIVLTIVGCLNYAGLAEKPLGFVVLLLAGSMAIGFAEEGLFRGLGVTAFRVNGYSEGKVALWTSVLFAVAHSASLLGGPLQVLSTLGAGYLYYLVRRISGGLLLAALVHGFWDFGVLSAGVVEDEVYGMAPAFLLVEIVLLLVLFVRRRHIEPEVARA